MIYVIKKKDGNIVSKDGYAGDEEASRALIEAEKAKNKAHVYEEVDQTTFESTNNVVKPANPLWVAAKASGNDAAIAFLAKQLGLE